MRIVLYLLVETMKLKIVERVVWCVLRVAWIGGLRITPSIFKAVPMPALRAPPRMKMAGRET
ncbi:MAG: hypothetical protein GXP41_10135 [Chloroflexi bacterium]|nr:hypothetical protein [Chloroflexota bacterium]